jgi:UDP-glucose 4-epimerase
MDEEKYIKHYLVTGASGLVGNAISSFLLNHGFRVTSIINNFKTTLVKTNLHHEYKVDLTKTFNLQTPQKVDFVIHCAAVIPKEHLIDEESFRLNQAIDKNIFTYCLHNNVPLIYFSSAYLYDLTGHEVITEDHQLKTQLKGYYLSKRMSELFLEQSEIKHYIFRLSSPYGDLERQNNVMKLFYNQIKVNSPVVLVGDGKRQQNFIYVEDIAIACLKASESKSYGIFNLVFDETYSMLDLCLTMKELLASTTEITFDKSKIDTTQNVQFNNSKMKLELNWRPNHDLVSGLKKTISN